MEANLKALEDINTWTIAILPPGKKAIGCKYVYKIKYNLDGTINKHKAKLVAKGFTQKRGHRLSLNFFTNG